jgi:hypothetical protein
MNAHDQAIDRVIRLRRPLDPKHQQARNNEDRDAHHYVPVDKPKRLPWMRKPPGYSIVLPPET